MKMTANTANRKRLYHVGIILTILSAFVCRQLTRSGTLPHAFDRPLGLIRSVLYLGFFFVWGISLNRRVTHKQVCRYLLGIDGLILFWLIIRTLKFYIVTTTVAMRYLWYLYYIPMLFVPMLGVLIALTRGKPLEHRVSGQINGIWVINILFFLAVITNDLHQKVFSFPREQNFTEWSDLGYQYSIIYYLIVAWLILCAFAALVIMIRECRIPQKRKSKYSPLIPMIASILYTFLYWEKPEWLWLLLDDLTITQSLLYVLTFELYIRCRLIASNTRYVELFRSVVGCSAQITDNDYNVCYQALDAVSFDKETLRTAEEKPVLLPDNRMLYNIPIKGGHAVWTEDVAEFLRLNADRKEVKIELEERNSLLRYEYTREKKQRELEEKKHLYDMLQNVTQNQSGKIMLLINEYQASGNNTEASGNILAHIAVLCAFIKRRRHIALLDYRGLNITAAEMENAFGETIRTLALLSIRGTYFVDVAATEGKYAALAYDFFEDCVEESVENLKAVNVSFTNPDGRLRVTVSLESEKDLTVVSQRYPDAVFESYGDEQTLMLPLDKIGDR